MNRNGIVKFLLVIIILAFGGAAGTAIYGAFKAGGTIPGVISILAVCAVGYILFSFILKKYRVFKKASDAMDNNEKDDDDDKDK